jgi:hypothetical protein
MKIITKLQAISFWLNPNRACRRQAKVPLLIAALLTAVVISFTACSGGGGGDELWQLAAPYLQINDTDLSWNTVSGASGYVVDIDGTEYQAGTNTGYSLSGLTTAKTYTIKVKAIGDNITTRNSEWSSSIQYTVQGTTPGGPEQLATPSGLQTNSTTKTLTWTAVANASGYTVDIDGAEYSAATNSFSLSVLSNYKTYTLKVKALGNETTYTDSEWSEPTEYELEEPDLPALATPVNVQISGTSVMWDTVSGAVRYSVEIDGVENGAATNSYSLLGLTTPGTYTIKVKAIGDNETNKNSEWSSAVTYTVTGSVPKEPTKGLAYTLIDGRTAYSVSQGTATATEIVIPPVYNNLPVTTIAEWGFSNYTAMTGITIPDSVTSIDYATFYGCSGLTSIILGNGVTSIDTCAFQNCSNLTSVMIPASMTSIGSSAFYDCSLISVFYGGADNTAWSGITNSDDMSLSNATLYFYSATQPTGIGNFWRFVDGVPTAWPAVPQGTKPLSITFAQITDASPSIAGPTLYRVSNGGPTSATLTVDNPGQYGSISWQVDNTAVTGTGESFTLSAGNAAYNLIGEHFVTVLVMKDGAPYNKTVSFKVEY